MNAPMTVPPMRPLPPKRLVPPITTAAIAARLSCVWAAIDAVAKRDTSITPTTPGEQTHQRVEREHVEAHVDSGARGRVQRASRCA